VVDEVAAVGAGSKPGRHYLLWRLVLLAAVVSIATGPPRGPASMMNVLRVVLVIALVLLISNLCIFRLRYSAIGSSRRNQPPAMTPVFSCTSLRTIGWVRVGLVKYDLYPTGLAVWAVPTGRFYVPFTDFDTIEPSVLRMGYVVLHHSPEIRMAIPVPAELISALQQYALPSWFPPQS